MPWVRDLPGAFEVTVADESDSIHLDLVKPDLDHHEAGQLAMALIDAGHEISFHRFMRRPKPRLPSSTG